MAVGLISVIMGLTVGAAGVAAVVIARHRAQSAADLSALAAAAVIPDGRAAACARAARLVSGARAELAECRADGLDVIVIVDVAVPLRVPGLGSALTARATARAGPVERP